MATGLTLDTGALLEIERGNRPAWLRLRVAHQIGKPLFLPAPVLAQAWRGPRSARIALVARWCEVVPMDELVARKAGELGGAARTSDVIDAMVAVVARDTGTDVVSSDPADMRVLIDALGGGAQVIQPSAL